LDYKVRGGFERPIACTEQNVIPLTRTIEFPRSLEQFEELANYIGFRRICNYANHHERS
jgi:hypothetical protein